jgi:tetratricopeptide (TPR) repeat protein
MINANEVRHTVAARGRRRPLCLFLFIYLCAALTLPAPALSQDGVQPSIPAQACELKTEPQECVLKDGEQIRVLPANGTPDTLIAYGERHWYALKLGERQFFQAAAEQMGVDLGLSICTRSGVRLAEVDRQSGAWGPEIISLIAPAAGDYLLQVRPLDRGASGRYRLKINEMRAAKTLDEVRVNAERIMTEGGKYYAKGNPDCLRASIEKYEEALKLWQSLNDDFEASVTLFGLGWSHSDLGSYGAVKFPESRHRLRWSYESRADHVAALNYFTQALDKMRARDDRHGQAITYSGRAWPNLYLGRNQEAVDDFEQARQLFQVLGNKRGEAIAVYGRGWAYALLNDNDKALENFQNALELRQEVKERSGVNNQRGVANTLAAISRMYNRLGRNTEALDYGRRALNLYVELKDVHGRASTQSILGWIYQALGAHGEALKAFSDAFELRDLADSTGRANALYGVARIKSEQGDLAGALATMNDVLALIEPLREKGGSNDLRTYYFANVQDYYEFHIALLMRKSQLGLPGGSPVEAFRINERARARELLAVLAESDGGERHEYDSALAAPLDAAGIQSLLENDTLLLEYSLGEERSYVWLVSPKEVLSYVLPGRPVLESKALQLYTLLTERNQLGPQSAGWRQRVERADADAQKVAAELSEMLLGQVWARLGNKRLLVVTQGALQLVPFGALPAPGTSDGAAAPPEPIIVSHEVVSLPSASVLGVLRRNAGRRPVAPKSIAVLADPVFTREDLRVRPAAAVKGGGRRKGAGGTAGQLSAGRPDDQTADTLEREAQRKNYRRLPGTRWEAQQIVASVPSGDGLAALDFAASRDMALSGVLKDYRIVHFATHAFVDDSRPEYSKIVLSQFDQSGLPLNGDLMLSDVYKMRLRADLVVLSACRTGLGTDTKGEGMVGLTGAFMHAGVPRVLVSLWPVSDRAAADFMARFYRKVLGPQKLPPTAALREVQTELWREGHRTSAYFWAPFVFNGEWRWR